MFLTPPWQESLDRSCHRGSVTRGDVATVPASRTAASRCSLSGPRAPFEVLAGMMLASAALTAFFFWTAWAAGTERPGATHTYTNNWPYEPLVGNAPTSGTFM